MSDADRIEQRQDFYDDGSLETERAVKVGPDGVEVNHGPYVRWHSNGIKAEEGRYEHGERVGLWRTWTADGRNFFDGTYLPGELADAQPPERPALGPQGGPVAAASDASDAAHHDEVEEPEESAAAKERAKELSWLNRSGKFRLWFETIAVMSLCWAAPLAFGLASWIHRDGVGPDNFAYDAAGLLGASVPVVLVLLYVVYRSEEAFAAFGLSRPRWRDVPIGVALCLVVYAVEYGLWTQFHWLRSSYVPPQPLVGGEYVLLVAMMLVNSVAEELGMRGFLIRRLSQLTRSQLIAWLLSSLLFASYHLYQGWVGGIGALSFGLAYGAVYFMTRRIWPLVIAHTCHNLLLFWTWFNWVVGFQLE